MPQDGPVRASVRVHLSDDVLRNLTEAQREDARAFVEVLERRLWAWESFPIRLPPTSFASGSERLIDVGDLFQAPTAEEVRELGTSDGGRGPRLAPEQQEQIRRTATFSVPSARYPGLSHVWQLGGVLQRGEEAIREDSRARLAAAATELLRVPDRLWRSRFSVAQALRDMREALETVPRLLAGLKEEHPAYPAPEVERRIENVRLRSLRVAFTGRRPPCDLRVFKRKVRDQVTPFVLSAQHRASVDWPALECQARVDERASCEAAGLQGAELAVELEDRVALRRNAAFFETLRRFEPLEQAAHGIGATFADHGKARFAVLEAVRRFDDELVELLSSKREALSREHPILSRTRWLDARIAAAVAAERAARLPAFVEGLPGLLEPEGLADEAAFLRHDLDFDRGGGARARARLEARRRGNRIFSLVRFIWRPSLWKIEQVPHAQPPQYVLVRHQTIRVSSAVPGWRLLNAGVRFWTWTSDAMFWLLFANVICGPTGLKALFLAEPFEFDWMADQETGKLVRNPAKRPTLLSRLRTLRGQRRKILDDFHARGDYGLLGKGFKRLMLVIPVDLILGFLAPLFLLAGQPLATLVNVAASLALTATAWAWAPAASVAWWAFNAILFDTEGTRYKGCGLFCLTRLLPMPQAILGFVFGGIGLAALSLAAAAWHVVLGSLMAVAAAARTAVRRTWDRAMRGLIAWRGRVPAADERFLVRRIKGPGLTAEHFFQVSPELVLVAMEAALESEALNLYARKTEHRIRAPRAAYEEVLAAFQVVSGAPAGFNDESGAFRSIARLERSFVKRLQDAVAERRKLYAGLLNIPNKSRIKLASAAHAPTLRKAVGLARSFYRRFAVEQGVGAPGDWEATANRALAAVFGAEFLTPLEPTDRSLKIEVRSPRLADLAAGIEAGLLPEDLKDITLTGVGRPDAPPAPKPRVPAADAGFVLKASSLSALLPR